LFNVSYNVAMPRKVPEGEKKEFQIGFRITHVQRERLDVIIARVKSCDKRVTDTEVYQELMSIKEPEFLTDKDRIFLWSGRMDPLPEGKHGPGVPVDDMGRGVPVPVKRKKEA